MSDYLSRVQKFKNKIAYRRLADLHQEEFKSVLDDVALTFLKLVAILQRAGFRLTDEEDSYLRIHQIPSPEIYARVQHFAYETRWWHVPNPDLEPDGGKPIPESIRNRLSLDL